MMRVRSKDDEVLEFPYAFVNEATTLKDLLEQGTTGEIPIPFDRALIQTLMEFDKIVTESGIVDQLLSEKEVRFLRRISKDDLWMTIQLASLANFLGHSKLTMKTCCFLGRWLNKQALGKMQDWIEEIRKSTTTTKSEVFKRQKIN